MIGLMFFKRGAFVKRKVISFFLMVVLVLGCFTATAPQASAATVVKPTSVSVTSKVSVPVRGAVTLKATLAPQKAGSALTWSSAKPAVATVSAKGVVTGKTVGSTKITVKTANGKSASCAVTVTKEILPTAVTLKPLISSVPSGNQTKIIATVFPENAGNKSITFSSADTAIATVDKQGSVSAKKKGVVLITAKTHNGMVAVCAVTVTAPIPADSVKVSQAKLSLQSGKTATVAATVAPSNVSNKTVAWSSSKTAVATVSSAGKITAKTAGTAVITAKSHNGKLAKCTVTVTASKPTEAQQRSKLNGIMRSWIGVAVNYSMNSSTAVINPKSPPKSLDCSAFTSSIYMTAFGINISRSSATQMNAGKKVDHSKAKKGDFSNLKIGDLIIFDWGGDGKSDHVGLYSGGGKYIHMTTSSRIQETNVKPAKILAVRRVIQADGTLVK